MAIEALNGRRGVGRLQRAARHDDDRHVAEASKLALALARDVGSHAREEVPVASPPRHHVEVFDRAPFERCQHADVGRERERRGARTEFSRPRAPFDREEDSPPPSRIA